MTLREINYDGLTPQLLKLDTRVYLYMFPLISFHYVHLPEFTSVFTKSCYTSCLAKLIFVGWVHDEK